MEDNDRQQTPSKGFVFKYLNERERRSFDPIKPSDIFGANIPQRDCIWPGFKTRTIASLVAPGGTGKSMFALEAAISVAGGPETDRRLLNLGIESPGKVAYLALDDDWEDIYGRFVNICPLDQPLIEDNFSLYHLEGEDPKFSLTPMKTGFGEYFCSDAQLLIDSFYGYRLIVFDTLSDVHELQENDNADMANLMTIFKQIKKNTGASILYLHHVNKIAITNKTEDQTAGRGATSLLNSTRYSVNLTQVPENKIGKMAEVDRNGNQMLLISEKSAWLYVKATVAKQNIGKKSEARWFKRDPETGVLRPVNVSDIKMKGGSHDRAEFI